MTELWRGTVNTWECDELGHMNVRHYWTKAISALDGLGARLGMRHHCRPDATSMLVPTQAHVRYLAEAMPGTPLHIRGGITQWHDTSLTVGLVMHHAHGQPAAGFTITAQHVTRQDLVPFAWPKRLTEQAKTVTADPAHPDMQPCIPRGVTHEQKILDHKALAALGTRTIGQGVFTPSDAAGRGIIAPDAYFGCASDSFPHLVADARDLMRDKAMNVAMVEARLTIINHARPGDVFQLRSGIARITGKSLLIIHHVLDPLTGEPWGQLEALCLFFDLNARKAVLPDPAITSALEPVICTGLMDEGHTD